MHVSNCVHTQGAVNGFEKVGSAGISNAPKMQGVFNFEFLNVASALEKAAEALQSERKRARIISEIWISVRCSNRIDHGKFLQGPKCQVTGT